MPTPDDPRLIEALHTPLQFFDNAQQHTYRRVVIKRTVMLLAISIVAAVIDFTYYQLNPGGTFPLLTNYSGARSSGALGLVWYAIILLLPPYCLYRFITLKRHMEDLARTDLLAKFPELLPLEQARLVTRRAKLYRFLIPVAIGVTVLIVIFLSIISVRAVLDLRP